MWTNEYPVPKGEDARRAGGSAYPTTTSPSTARRRVAGRQAGEGPCPAFVSPPNIPSARKNTDGASYDDVKGGSTAPSPSVQDRFISPGRPGHPPRASVLPEEGTGATRLESRPPGGFWQWNGPGCDTFLEKTLFGDTEKVCPLCRGSQFFDAPPPKGPPANGDPKTSSGPIS
jgi:hypothetical protein